MPVSMSLLWVLPVTITRISKVSAGSASQSRSKRAMVDSKRAIVDKLCGGIFRCRLAVLLCSGAQQYAHPRPEGAYYNRARIGVSLTREMTVKINRIAGARVR